ncbi:MAG: HAMP domain-containing histidine kinase [Rubrivivax sp.]|nr:HAMP domain-containing histidine kinase [Rubrivivax sp.]
MVDGSGLGLAIVQEVAIRHAATVSIEDARPRHGDTEVAPGARFTVRLPRGTPEVRGRANAGAGTAAQNRLPGAPA